MAFGGCTITSVHPGHSVLSLAISQWDVLSGEMSTGNGLRREGEVNEFCKVDLLPGVLTIPKLVPGARHPTNMCASLMVQSSLAQSADKGKSSHARDIH